MSIEKPKVFISHSWEDKPLVFRLERQLKAAGIEVWVDHSNVRGGDRISKIVSDALEWCNTVVLFWSYTASKSRWVELEWNAAINAHKKIIPCLLDNTKLTTILAGMAYIDFRSFDQGSSDLLRTLKNFGLESLANRRKRSKTNWKRAIGFSFLILGGLIWYMFLKGAPITTKPDLKPPIESRPQQKPRELLQLGIEAYDKKNFEEAFQYFEQAANAGNIEAQWHVGEMLFHAEGVRPDTVKSVAWIRKAAENGLAIAQTQLGNAYFAGSGIDKDFNEALKWIKRGADEGDTEGLLSYGLIFYCGLGVKSDTNMAVIYLRKAAEKGHPVAQAALSTAYFNGFGVPKDIGESGYWIRRAIAQGNLEALCVAGLWSIRDSKLNEHNRNNLKLAYLFLYLVQGKITEKSIFWTAIKNHREEFNEVSLKLSDDEKADILRRAREFNPVSECEERHGHIVKPFEKSRQGGDSGG